MKMKRGQIEIVGLLIIVLFISFLLLFIFSQTLLSDDDDLTGTKDSNLASSWLYAMLATDVNCTDNTDMRGLIIDCATISQRGPSDLVCDDGRDSCDFINDTLDIFLDSTYGEWARAYVFYVTLPDSENAVPESVKKGGDFSRASSCRVLEQPMQAGIYDFGRITINIGVGNCEYMLDGVNY